MSDERLDYFLTLARLLAEAEDQLRAHAEDPVCVGYETDLADLRRSLRGAEDAAARIAVGLARSRIGRAGPDRRVDAARH